jgi:hypothetical protein
LWRIASTIPQNTDCEKLTSLGFSKKVGCLGTDFDLVLFGWGFRSIYQKDLVMLNSGLGQRLKRPRSIWMG